MKKIKFERNLGIFLSTAILVVFSWAGVNAQGNIGVGTSTPDSSAVLDLVSTNSGVLIPRVDTGSISGPATGLMTFQISDSTFYYYSGTRWARLGSAVVDKDGDTRVLARDHSGSQDSVVIYIDGIEKAVFKRNGGGDLLIDNKSSASKNVFLGTGAGTSATSALFNTAIGYQAMHALNGGNFNTAIGYFALWKNTIGGFNTAVGESSLVQNTTGSRNTSVGINALWANKGNSRSTAIGYQVMQNADNRTIGRESFNTAVGYKALYGSGTASNNTGRYNTSIGDSTMANNTSGSSNTAVGRSALTSNTTGNNNTAIGKEALALKSSGDNNTAIGRSAMHAKISGDNNTAIGDSSGYHNSAGFGNIFLGHKAGFNETGNSTLYIENSDTNSNGALIYGDFSTDKLRVNGTLGVGLLPNHIPLNLKGNSSNDLIQYFDKTGAAQWHTQIIGDGFDFVESGVAGNRLHLAAGGNVGIGTGTPASKLDVEGSLAVGAAFSGASAAPANGAIFEGNVGIGISGPTTRLDVRNNGKTLLLKSQTSGNSTYLEFNNSSSLVGLLGADGFGFSGTADQLTIATWSNHPIKFFTNQAERMAISNSGKVGIGTAAQAAMGLTLRPVVGDTYSLLIEDTTGTDKFMIDNGGHTGVNGFYDDVRFTVRGDATDDCLLLIQESDLTAILRVEPHEIGINAVDNNVTLNVQGRPSEPTIFTAEDDTEDNKFSVFYNGGIYMEGPVGIGNGTLFTHPIQTASGAHCTAAGVWTNASDFSRKYNITSLGYGLTEILKLRPSTYFYKVDDSRSIGFVAQEMEKVIPEAVSGVDGNKGIAYGLLTAVLVNGMQEQQDMIQRQQMLIKSQEARIAKLESAVLALLDEKSSTGGQ